METTEKYSAFNRLVKTLCYYRTQKFRFCPWSSYLNDRLQHCLKRVCGESVERRVRMSDHDSKTRGSWVRIPAAKARRGICEHAGYLKIHSSGSSHINSLRHP
jgi:hypothetical protein